MRRAKLWEVVGKLTKELESLTERYYNTRDLALTAINRIDSLDIEARLTAIERAICEHDEQTTDRFGVASCVHCGPLS